MARVWRMVSTIRSASSSRPRGTCARFSPF